MPIIEEEEVDLYEENLAAKAARRQRRRENAAHKTMMNRSFMKERKLKGEARKDLILDTIYYKKWCQESACLKKGLPLKYKGETRKGLCGGACNDRLTKGWKNCGRLNEIVENGCNEGPAAYWRWITT